MVKKIKFGSLQKKYQGKIFTIYQRPVVLPNGKKDTFEYCSRPASVLILALNTKQELLLIRERRAGNGKIEWFLPAGQVEKKELPRKAAQRELREEGGYAAKKWVQWKQAVDSDKMIWPVYLFLATDLSLSPLPLDVGEEILERRFVPIKQAEKMALEGEIENNFIAYAVVRLAYMVRHGRLK